MKTDFFYRPGTARRLARIGMIGLALTVLAEFVVHLHAGFRVAEFFAFHALYGFGSCVLMVWFAKALGKWIKRKEDYYDDE